MKVSELRIYPVKSCRGISVTAAELRPRGFQHDRRAMIVSPDGNFMTQRSHAKLAQIIAEISPDFALKMGGKHVPVRLSGERMNVTVWKSEVSAQIAADEVNTALSEFLGQPARLVSMDDVSARKTSSPIGGQSDVSFADGYPYLITTTASLAALSETAGGAIPMDRFRPNIVIDTDTPWLEDNWTRLTIGGAIFDIVKPCTRCVMTTLDQATGAEASERTMEALVKTRSRAGDWGKGVIFGVNAIARDVGPLQTGMAVTSH